MEAFEIKEDKLIAFHLREETVYVPDGIRIIGAGAFKGCTSMKKVFLPASVECIEEHAFKGCRQLEFISFSDKLNYIGAYAFHRCHHLKEIQLPEKLTELSDCAFLYCDNLEFASLPGVCKMGKQAFVNAINLKKLVISPNLLPECISDSFTGCTRIEEISIAAQEIKTYATNNLIAIMESKEEIPEIIRAIATDIYHMMDIENGVLVEFHVEPKEVVIPEGIREIGKSCFFNKRGILQIYLPESLEKIGERAFRNCMNLEHIILQNANIKIEKDAFQNCTTLKQVTLNQITYSLAGLPNLTENHSVPELVRQIHTQLLGNFCISGTVLLRYWGNEARVTVPDGITIIGERAFAGNEAVGKLILPESVVEIQREAFADCLVLQTLNFPKGLQQIGVSALEGCVKLLRVEIPAGIRYLSPSVFSRCRKLGQVVWEEGSHLCEIGQQAFYGCHKLKDITFPETVERIGTLAFYQCHSLHRITLPKSVWKVEAEAFACCKGLQEVKIEGVLTEWGKNIFAYAEKLRKIAFYGKQKVIPDYLAWKCEKLSQFILPDSIQMVGFAALDKTAWMEELPIPKIWKTIFLDGKNETGDVIIPEGITAIAAGAFYGNQNITSVTLPSTVEQIGERAFCNCILLKEIRLPKKVTILSNGVFAYCFKLKRILAEGRITEVGEKACYQCEDLQEIPDLYQTVIKDQAFYGCRSWRDGVIVEPKIGALVFTDTEFLNRKNQIIWEDKEQQKKSSSIVIENIIVDGSYATGEEQIVMGDAIAPYAYYGNTQITKVVLPEGLKEIGAFAFFGCIQLCEVVIPDSVERIGNSAFEKCTSLFTISSMATEIGERTFACNENLRFASLPNIKELQKETFFHCTSLETVEIKEVEQLKEGCLKSCLKLNTISIKAKRIGEEVFADCENLSKVTFLSEVWIAAKAFLDCCSLKTLIFTNPAITFDSSAFWGSTFLEEIQIENQAYFILEYQDLFREELPELVRRIYASAISCFLFQSPKTILEYRTDAKAIRIPDGIQSILGEVFRNCIQLERIEIPKSVTYIGERAFWGTEWLRRKQEETPLVICNQILLDGSSANGCVVIPNEVRIISGWAFSNCYGLRELVFLNSNLIVEPHAFRNCIYLKSITTAEGVVYPMNNISVRKNKLLPNKIKQIFEDALNCYKTDKEGVLIECTGNITNFALVRGITAIGNQVFENSNLLTRAQLTKDVEWIGKRAFADCRWLTLIERAEGVKEVGAMAFFGCIRLEKVIFSNQLIQIGKQAFADCVSLKKINLPEGMQEIPEQAFFRCRRLKKLVLPQSLKQIGEEAFAFCSSLEEVVLPEGLQKIGKRAFAWCQQLKNIQLPSGVEIEKEAFLFSASVLLPEENHKEK